MRNEGSIRVGSPRHGLVRFVSGGAMGARPATPSPSSPLHDSWKSEAGKELVASSPASVVEARVQGQSTAHARVRAMRRHPAVSLRHSYTVR